MVSSFAVPRRMAFRLAWVSGLIWMMTLWGVDPAPGQSRQNAGLSQPPVVDRVVIEGNIFIDQDRIRDLMITRETGMFRKKRLNLTTLRADVDAIENFYQNSGYLNARVRALREEVSKDRVLVRVVVDEGPRFMVNAVHLIGFHNLSEEEVRRALLTRPGQPYFRLFVAADKRAIQTLADRKALLDARIQINQARDDQDTTVTVTMLIYEGEPIRVGDVRLRGLRKTRDFVILRELEIKSGQLYDNALLSRSQTRLFQTGLFRSVRIEPDRTDTTTSARDLMVSLTELPGGEVSFGGGFASVEKFRISFSIAHRNWLGRAITIGANGQFSLLIQQIDAGITQPWLFRTRTTGTLRSFFIRQDRRSYIQREIGGSIIASRELSRTFRSQTTYTLKNVTVSSLSDSLSRILQTGSAADSLRSRREGSITQILLYDTRDDILSPSIGFFGQIQGSLASPILGSSSANKNSTFTVNAIFRKYIPIKKFPDLATSLSIAYVRAINRGLIPLDKRLFLGGDKSVRGFGIDQIGQPAGGVLAISSQNEIRFAFSGIMLIGFLDLGGVGKTVRSFKMDDIQMGYGAGLRFQSPIGMIRGDVGLHQKGSIDPPDAGLYDRTYFYFGLGQAF